jgi:hypothetical protein
VVLVNVCPVDIWKEFSILPVACLYIPEIVCYMKNYKESVEQNVQIRNYSMWKKIGSPCSLQQCKSFKEKQSEYRNWTVLQGTRLHKRMDKDNLLKGNWDPFCYNMHFIQWTNMCHIDNIWIVLICEIHKLLCLNC